VSYQNGYYNEYHEGLVGLSKGFLDILLNKMVDMTMIAAVNGDEGNVFCMIMVKISARYAHATTISSTFFMVRMKILTLYATWFIIASIGTKN
jgi:hypothetical protein